MKKKFLPYINRRFVHTFGITCGAETLPETDFDFCDPEVKLSEIQRMFLAKIGAAPFTDWSQPEEWNERVSETGVDIDSIRPLTVIGDKPAPTTTRKDISNGRKVVTRKDHVINFTIDEVTDTNHELVQFIETGKRYRLWYETAGGFMFGGNSGIIVEIVADMVLARGQGEIMVYQGTATWVSQQTEERIESPIFAETILGSDALDTTIDFTADATPAHGDADFVLAGGVDPVAKFSYNDISPATGGALVMTVKVGGVLKLTCNMKTDWALQPFTFIDELGASHSGLIQSGDVLF